MERDIGCALQKLVKTAVQSFHYQHREAGLGKEANAQELDDVWMAKIGEEAAFVVVFFHHLLGALVNRVDEGVEEFLSRADKAIFF